ncbi:hypothetical protein NQ857_16590 [Acinetobacter baumannii]|nr:hypothetical protein [Acinetobacter baumannii]
MAPIAVLFGLHDWKRQHLTGEKLKLLFEINELIGDIKRIIDDIRDRNFYMMIKIGDFDYHEDFKNYLRKYYEIVNNIALKNHSLEFIDLDGDLREVKKILDILEIISKNFYDSYNYFRAEIKSENQRTAELFDIHRMMLSSEPVKLLTKDPKKIINEVDKRYTSHFKNIHKILKKAATKI